MAIFNVFGVGTISLCAEVEADSFEQAHEIAEGLSVPGLCHHCMRSDRYSDDEWVIDGVEDSTQVTAVDHHGGGLQEYDDAETIAVRRAQQAEAEVDELRKRVVELEASLADVEHLRQQCVAIINGPGGTNYGRGYAACEADLVAFAGEDGNCIDPSYIKFGHHRGAAAKAKRGPT